MIVVGAGGMNNYYVQIATALGAKVVAVDVDTTKLEAIAPHGPIATLNAHEHDLKALKNTIGKIAKDHGCPTTE